MFNKIGAIGLLFVPALLPAPKAEASPEAERALLDQYCVVCHNDKLKTANLLLQSADINSVGNHPEIWEPVIRKICRVPHLRNTSSYGTG
jgi:hypothetical protein